jgi:aminopeptidase N
MNHASSGSSRIAGAALLIAWVGAYAAPYSFDTTPGRLSKDVVPIDYTIDLSPDATALSIAGHESIVLEFRKAAAIIQFDSLNETLSDVALDGKPVKSTVSDDKQQLTTVTLKDPAPAGHHTLSFSYTGKIEQEARGLFVQHYRQPDGTSGVMLSTQLESIDARRVFPCWDEPAFRATFTISATLPSTWTAVSNMPVAKRVVAGALATTTFARTPRMSAYLVELTTGDLAEIGANVQGVRFGIWAVRGREHDGAQALANAEAILADYSDYFGYPFPLPKLDSIAIPGGWSGAMENWGAITYMDLYLLEKPQSTLADRQVVFTIQAHEMAHQWFGDLVTLAWWDEEWLNESMTFWMEQKETALRHPEWLVWESEDLSKEVAMRADAQSNSEAIHVHVTDESAAADSYDQDMVGGKGQTVMRMFEAYLGPEKFRAGLRTYMKARALSNATGADLWNALATASGGIDVAGIIGPWAEQPGFPLVTVATHCNGSGVRTLSLSQHRFLFSGEDKASLLWSVPLRIRSGAQGEPQSVLFASEGRSVTAGRCGEPLSINADGLGYFRASYDAPTISANAQSFARLADGDKIALLDDQWALVESGTASLPSYLKFAEAMGEGLDARAWQQIEQALGAIEHAERGTAGHDAFTAYARSVLKAPFDRLGWDAKSGDTPGVQKLRHALIGDLGAWGEASVAAEARRRFAAFVIDHRRVAPDDRGALLSVVGHHADAATFDQLYALARATNDTSELQRYLGAIASVDDPTLAARAAAMAVSDDIPPQADSLRFYMLAELAGRHGLLSWQTFTANSAKALIAQGAYADETIAQNIPQIYGTEVPLAQIESWVRSKVPPELSPVVERGMAQARFERAEQAALIGAADAYLRGRGSSAARDHANDGYPVVAKTHALVEPVSGVIFAHDMQHRDLPALQLPANEAHHQAPGEPPALEIRMRADTAYFAQGAGL